jgi:hypothetical protein
MGNGKDAAGAGEQVWLVLQRDLSVWLRGVTNSSYLSLVLDRANPGNSVAEAGLSPGESLRKALTLAASKRGQETGVLLPDRVQVPVGLVAALRAELPQLERETGFHPEMVIEEVTPEDGAEGVFDHLIAQVAQRQPPEEPLRLEDAIFLYEHARRFMEAQPWTRWTSEDALLVELKLGSQKKRAIAHVLGHALTQPGVFVMPGEKRITERMASREQLPVGTLFMQLEGAEIPPDLFLRARRYGWPADAAVSPNFIGIREHGFSELERHESWPFALVLAGLVAHFNRPDAAETWGHLDLPIGHRGRYRVRKAPDLAGSPPMPSDREMLGTKISSDLLPDNSEVQIGLLGAGMLAKFRDEAEVRLPSRFPFPAGVDPIPVITMTPANRDFQGVADRLRRAKPIGVTVIERKDGPMLTIMGERAGFVILDDQPSATVWKRNIRNSDGAHVLIVTDRVINQQDPDPDRPGAGAVGRIYGLFECMLRGGVSRPIET